MDEGEGGQKSQKYFGRPIWMGPPSRATVAISSILDFGVQNEYSHDPNQGVVLIASDRAVCVWDERQARAADRPSPPVVRHSIGSPSPGGRQVLNARPLAGKLRGGRMGSSIFCLSEVDSSSVGRVRGLRL